jgi:hypothetical protein
MRKNENTSSAQNEPRSVSAVDIIVILFCLLGTAACLFLFYRDINRGLLKINETPIGTISFKYKAAQRRFIDRMMWDRIKQDSPVYTGDLIRTADLSEATITFPSGGKISLAENSIVQVFPDRIDFSQGDINFSTVGSDKGIIITSGGKTLDIAAGSMISLSADGGGNVDARVLEGSALIDSGGGAVELQSGNALFVDSRGTAAIQSQAVPLSPHPGVTFLFPLDGEAVSPRPQVHFVWNKVDYAPGSKTRLEVASDRNFSRIAEWADVDSTEASLPLDAGIWYWRVYPVAPDGEIAPDTRDSGAQKFTLVNARAPVLISPSSGAVFSYHAKFPEVRFMWQETQEASAYIIEIAPDSAFTNPTVRTQTRSSSFLTSTLQEGVWFWRVVPMFIGDYAGNVDASAVSSFSIERKSETEAPVLTSPQNGAFFNISEDRQNAYFSWKRDAEADSYVIKISRNADLSAPAVMENVRENFFSYPSRDTRLTDGAYYWGVTPVYPGVASTSSSSFSFTALKADVEHRTLFPPEGYAIAEDALTETRFSWRTNIPARMRFQVSSSRDFSSPLVDELASSESASGHALVPGTYYWRIAADTSRAEESDMELLSRFVTEPKSFVVVPQFARPIPETPAENERIFPAANTEFRWSSVAGAQYYRIRVYDSRDNVVAEQNAHGTSAKINMANRSGNYHWTVQAFSDGDSSHSRRTGLVSRTSFLAATPDRVALVYPRNGVTVTGFNTSNSAGVVRWESKEKITQSRFVLSRNADPLRGTPLVRVNNPPKEIRLTALAAGTYYWTITAEAEGFDVSAGKVFSFTVPALPPLAAATGLKPDSVVFGIRDIQDLQRMGFSWNTVENANAYIFTLWHRAGDSLKQIAQTRPQNQTAHEIDLQNLDVGAFEWQVEAVLVGTDGNVEQHGDAAVGTFVIDIPLPDELQLYEAGMLYGN